MNKQTSAYPYTLVFTKTFNTGILKGKTYHDSLPVVSVASAKKWLEGVRANCQEYQVSDVTVTNIVTMKVTRLAS